MQPQDLVRVERVGEAVHPDYPEDPAVFCERLQLYPAGCFVLDGADGLAGYAIGHPWFLGRPPALNTYLRSLPVPADTFYIHDVALMAGLRGSGLGVAAVDLLACEALEQQLASMSLVAVGGSERFWCKQGFAVVALDGMQAKLASYGAAARFMVRRLA